MSWVRSGEAVPTPEGQPLASAYGAAAKFIADVVRLGTHEECHVLARPLGGVWFVEVRAPSIRSDSLFIPAETLDAAGSPTTAKRAREEILAALWECESLFNHPDEANPNHIECNGPHGCRARFPFRVPEMLGPTASVNCPVCGDTIALRMTYRR